jgi:hypothetical protein
VRSPLVLSLALLVGCSLPVDEFQQGTEPGTETDPNTAASPIANKCDGLPSPQRYLAARSSCYFAAPGKHKGTSAAAACAAIKGAHLVTIASDEQAPVVSLTEQLGTEVWIGLRAADEDAEFVWTTGETDAFRAWRPDYPKEDGGLCAIAKKDGRWENRKCDDEFVALCEL